MSDGYQTAPLLTDRMPKGIPYIIGNEAAERFSFYGMRAILFVLHDGIPDRFGGRVRRNACCRGDVLLSSVRRGSVCFSDCRRRSPPTLCSVSIVPFYICRSCTALGHLALAMDHTRFWLFAGLALIAVGTGAIKPCVSAHVGDQFGEKNKHLMAKVFSWFYFSINLGAVLSSLLTPKLLAWFGPGVAFGVPGILMAIATIVFWMGRRVFIHVPAGGVQSVKEVFSDDGLRAILNLVPIYICVAVFWSLFDQTGSSWVDQAKRMDRHWLGVDWLPSQIQAANPLLILILIPTFSYVIYPAINRVIELTPLRKLGIGFFLTIIAFAIPSWIESRIDGGAIVSITSEGDSDRWPAAKPARRDKQVPTPARGSPANGRRKTNPSTLCCVCVSGRAWPITGLSLHRSSISEFLRDRNAEAAEAKLSIAARITARLRRMFMDVDLSQYEPNADTRRFVSRAASRTVDWQRAVGRSNARR